jgi:hypothetical protein
MRLKAQSQQYLAKGVEFMKDIEEVRTILINAINKECDRRIRLHQDIETNLYHQLEQLNIDLAASNYQRLEKLNVVI